MRQEARRSKQLVAQAEWRAQLNDEESRAYLQARLLRMSGFMFWSFVAFLVSVETLYLFDDLLREGKLRPKNDAIILAVSAAGLALLGYVWRGLLRRRTLAITTLDRIDLLYATGTGACFAMGGYLAPNLQPAPYMCLLFTSLMVLTRAIIVPSSGPRTLMMSIAAFVPYVFAGIGLILEGWDPIPAPAIMGGIILTGAVVSALAVNGSNTLYGLRQRAQMATQLGQYTLERKIGQGGMGQVYLARHVLLRRPTAIKLLLPDQIGIATIDRFEREVHHMSQLTHPNTVAIFDFGRSYDGMFYYAMEFLDGIDLDRLVKQHGPLPSDRVVSLLIQLCGALSEAHARGIIHRDVKPANMILCERGGQNDVVKLLDFGLVKSIASDDAADEARLRKTLTIDKHEILGTPGYLSPEAITAPKDAGPAADIYSLGCVAFYLLTGQRVFSGNTPLAICVEHVSKDAPRPSTIVPVPEPLESLVMRCLTRDPSARPTAVELTRALRALPAASNWTDDNATAWWTEHRAQVAAPVTAAGPQTMNVDLAARISDGGP